MYNTNKKFNRNQHDTWQPKFGDTSTVNKRYQSDPQADAKVDLLKLKYGAIIFQLIKRGISTYEIASAQFSQKIMEDLQTLKTELVTARQACAKFLSMAFFIGLELKTEVTDDADPTPQCVVVYNGGTGKVSTKTMTTRSQLDRYCDEIYTILTRKDMLPTISSHLDGISSDLDQYLASRDQEAKENGGNE